MCSLLYVAVFCCSTQINSPVFDCVEQRCQSYADTYLQMISRIEHNSSHKTQTILNQNAEKETSMTQTCMWSEESE